MVVYLVIITSQLISMLFLHVPTPFTFFGITSGAVQQNQHNVMIMSFKGTVQHFGKAR